MLHFYKIDPMIAASHDEQSSINGKINPLKNAFGLNIDFLIAS